MTPKTITPHAVLSPETEALWEYASTHTLPEDPLLQELVRYTHLHVMNPRMLSGHIQGKLLEQIACMIRPQAILEIGTYTGYSAICLAKGLAADGVLHSIERNDELYDTAQSFVSRSAYADKIILHTGDARDIIPMLPCTFDLVYIDGDKREYCDYYRVAFDKVRAGGFILADNVLWDGKVVHDAASGEGRTQGIAAFNTRVQSDPRVENVLLPFGDGLMIARKT
ncbi:MAG: O-methyltransferase [Prevotellaceae bacterium]|jgi:predicted O-methyltransferase YrrM|nr:O-methyltransferase [Prevotellaceae bacterium]